MRMLLNGWRRLWIVAAVSWGLVVIVGAAVTWPPDYSVPAESALIERLPSEHRALLKGFIPDDGLQIEMPNGHVLKFHQGVTTDQATPVTKAYAAVVESTVAEMRTAFVRNALLIWLVPLSLVYAIGEGIAWVRRGFAGVA